MNNSKKKLTIKTPDWVVVSHAIETMANKEFTKTELKKLLTFIQEAFDAKRPGANKTPNIAFINQVQTLLVNTINKSIASKKILFKVPATMVERAREINKSYLSKNKPKRKPISGAKEKEIELSGLSGLGIITTTDLAKQEFVTLPFEGKFKDLIGNPTKPFQIMVYGLPGSGKSTLAIMFAKYLAENHQFKVLYLAKEEGISGTSQEKFIRLNAIHPNIHITEKMPTDLSFYDVLFIDSVNEMNMTPDSLRAIIKQYPKLSTVQLFKATKEGKFLGQSDFAHLCQAEIRCFENKAQAQKNRFGGNKEVTILE